VKIIILNFSGIPRKLKPQMGKKYAHVDLCLNKKPITCSVHKLVLMAFMGRPLSNQECCHKDGNRRNNKPDNLEWKTHKENESDKRLHGTLLVGSRNPISKLTESDVVKIISAKGSLREIGNKYGVSKQCTWSIKKGKGWKHITQNLLKK